MKRLIPVICASLLLFSNAIAEEKAPPPPPPAPSTATPSAPEQEAPEADKSISIASEIIDMRSSLARDFIKPDAQITEETFNSVCGAVGKRAKEIMDAEGVIIRHATTKQRNPKNAASPDEAELISRFYSDKKLSEIFDEATMDGKTYLRYTRPIYTEEACLACHGAREKRPKFIVEKYPGDRAFGFKKGDLRGIISVLTPKK